MGADDKTGFVRFAATVGLLALLTHGATAQTVTNTDIAQELQRQAPHRELFRYDLDPGMVDAIRQATNGNYALGDARFGQEISSLLGRRAVKGSPGRPTYARDSLSGELF